VRVRLLGTPLLEGDSQPYPPPGARKSWAVLTRLALAERPLFRRQLADELFCSAEDPLGALRWTLCDLRRCLRIPTALRGDPVQLPPTGVEMDVWELERGSLPTEELGGTLLDGVEVRGCPGFDLWLLMARQRCWARSRGELRARVLRLLADGDASAAVPPAARAAALAPLDEGSQELLLRTLVAAGLNAQATVHLAACENLFARAGIRPSRQLREAARGRQVRPALRAAVVAKSLLQAGRAALGAGAADAGVQTLRSAAEEAGRADDQGLLAESLEALGAALVHAVRGADGEGALVLHRALLAARVSGRLDVHTSVLRELAFIDVQAGRHACASRALRQAHRQARAAGDWALQARVIGLEGMNEADLGHHHRAAELLTAAAAEAERAGDVRQQAWSLGVLSRSLALVGDVEACCQAADTSTALARQQRWTAFLPWPLVISAQTRAAAGGHDGGWDAARAPLEEAFTLACTLGDPCWEGMAARALGLASLHLGDVHSARSWLEDARKRCDRVSDRYVWVSGYIGLAEIELAAFDGPAAVVAAATRLQEAALDADLPEFYAWALVHRGEAGETQYGALAREAAAACDDPGLRARAKALR